MFGLIQRIMNLVRFISRRFSSRGDRKFLNFARLVALLSVMLGTIALILSLSILDGFEKELRNSAVKFTSHLTITKMNREPIFYHDEMIKRLHDELPGFQSAVPVIERECLIKSKTYIDGIIMKGVYPEYDIMQFSKNMIQGKYSFSSHTAKELILSRTLADKLGVKQGESLLLYVINSAHGQSPKARTAVFKVCGIYATGMLQYDETLVFAPYEVATDLSSMRTNEASKIEVMLNDISLVDKNLAKAQSIAGFPHTAISYYDYNRPIFAWIELQKEPIPIVLGLISIVAVLNIVTTLLITVIEKSKSIGVLRALGLRNKDIIGIFINQGLMLGVAGSIFGGALALGFSLLQQNYHLIKLDAKLYYLDALPITINPVYYAVVISLTVVLALVSTIIPSVIAAKVSPLRAITFK